MSLDRHTSSCDLRTPSYSHSQPRSYPDDGRISDLTFAPKTSGLVTLEDAERSHIRQTLQQAERVVGGPYGAAARLGVRRTTLISKMRRLGLNRGNSNPTFGGGRAYAVAKA